MIRPNAYLVIDGNDQPLGVYNSRQLHPHRSAAEDETATEFENERHSPILNMILTSDTDLDPLPENGEEQTEEEESTTTEEEQENHPLNVTYNCKRSRWQQDDVEEKRPIVDKQHAYDSSSSKEEDDEPNYHELYKKYPTPENSSEIEERTTLSLTSTPSIETGCDHPILFENPCSECGKIFDDRNSNSSINTTDEDEHVRQARKR